MSLYSKKGDEGKGGSKISKNGWHHLWMASLTKKLDGLFFGISWWCSIWVTNDDDYMVIIYIYFFKSSNYLSIIVCFAPLLCNFGQKKLRYHMDVDDVLLSDRKKWYTITSILISKAKNSPLDFNFRSSQNILLGFHNLFTYLVFDPSLDASMYVAFFSVKTLMLVWLR